MDKTRLKQLLANMTTFDSGLGDAFKSVEREMLKVANNLRQEAETKTVNDVKEMTTGFREQIKIGLDSIVLSFDKLKTELEKNDKSLTNTLNLKLDDLKTTVANFRTADAEQIKVLSSQIPQLKADIKELSDRKVQIPDFASQINKIQDELKLEIQKLSENVDVDIEQFKGFDKRLTDFEKDVTELRSKTLSALVSHGGNANRNISVNNNSSTLSRYTDLNIKAGSNVTLTYSNNDNLKTTDLTIASSGGGGGTSRNISTVSVSSVVSALASTDIVIIANQGIKLNMPTAVSNTNLYTIKNTSTSSVMVVANGAETIDGSGNIVLTTQYTSVDLISDNSNWQVT